MEKPFVPPEIVHNVVEIITYLAAALVGWVAKLLTSKKKQDERQQ